MQSELLSGDAVSGCKVQECGRQRRKRDRYYNKGKRIKFSGKDTKKKPLHTIA